MKKLFILLFSALLLLQCAACGSPEAAETTAEITAGEAAAEVQEMETEAETTLASVIQTQYAETGYDGYEYRILAITPGGHFYSKINSAANEIWYAEQTGDIYDDAIFDRNIQAETLLDIKITPLWGSDYTNVGTQVGQFVKAGDDAVDLALTALSTNITLATSGTLYNLYKSDAVTLESEWYDQGIVKNYSYKGNKLFCVTGAYNVFDDYAVPVIFYGRDVLTQHGMTDPSEYVREGTWTLDVMMGMAETVTMDLDGNGVMDDSDAYVYLDNTDFYPHLLEGAGQPRTTVGDDGIPVLNITNADYLDAGEKVYNLVVDSNAKFIGSNATSVTIMKENRGLFYYELLGAINEFRDMESDFSLLPMPMYEETLDNYTSAINPIWCTSMAIPVTVADAERCGTVLEVLSALSVETVDSALYEVLLGSKLVRDTVTLEMLDYVWNSKVYDWANGFSWSSAISNALSTQANANSFVLASAMESAYKAANKSLSNFLGKLDEVG